MVSITPVKRKVRGTVRAIDLEHKTCVIRTSKGRLMNCFYDEQLEPEIKDALDLEVEVTVEPTIHVNGRRTQRLKIEEIEVISEFDFEAHGLKQGTMQDLLNSEIIGMWKDRPDLEDVDEFMRKLRS